MSLLTSIWLLAAVPCPDCPAAGSLDLGAMTLPTVMVSGLVDGFNPCAFSIVIILAGILATHPRRGRLLAGGSFCLATYLTYVAMGLGFLRVLKALSGFAAMRTGFLTLLSLSLFVLSFLSVRDALAYRRKRCPQALTLQLPDGVKRLIRTIAERSWSGSAVVCTGFLCGLGVTVLDSLCTGQVYVPIVALISREGEAWRELALLLVYNLAFISPLIAVFVLAANGATAQRMSLWSKRNVIPSKLALATVFFILALVTLPKCDAFGLSPRPSTPPLRYDIISSNEYADHCWTWKSGGGVCEYAALGRF